MSHTIKYTATGQQNTERYDFYGRAVVHIEPTREDESLDDVEGLVDYQPPAFDERLRGRRYPARHR